MKIVQLNGNGKARDAAMEICKGIEIITNPIRLLNTGDGGTTPDCFDLYKYIEGKFTHAINPAYEGLEKQMELAGGLADVLLDMRLIEREAWFGGGCLLGMRRAGQPMEEVQKLGLSIVTRKKCFGD